MDIKFHKPQPRQVEVVHPGVRLPVGPCLVQLVEAHPVHQEAGELAVSDTKDVTAGLGDRLGDRTSTKATR